jgi:Na+-driven multidrug efflux pump
MVALDVVLNPLLIAGVGPLPRLAIAGSAFSTLVAQLLTLAAMLAHLYRKESLLALRPSDWGLLKPDPTIVRTLLVKGVPMSIQMMVISLAAVTMLSFVNAHGTGVTAAYSAAAQLWTYVQMPAMSLGAAVSAMAAQNVGAGRMDRVGEIARRGVLFAGLISAAVVLLIFLGDTFALRAFLPAGSPSLPTAVHINSIVLWGFIPFGMAFIFNGVVRATGAVWPPLLAMLIGLWGFRVPFAVALGERMGADAIWVSFPLGNLLLLALAGGYYVWGGWRTSRMMPSTPPSTDEPDTGFGQPMIEEAEALADAASRSSPSVRNRPGS